MKSFIGGTFRNLALRKKRLENLIKKGVLKDPLVLSTTRLIKV